MITAVGERQGKAFAVTQLGIVGLALIVSVLWLVGNAGQLLACKCAQPGTPSEELEESSAVFAGRVVSVRRSYDPDAASVTPEDYTTRR